MSIPDDKPPSDKPPSIKKIIEKLSDKHGLKDYAEHLVFYQDEETNRFKELLLLQGLDEDDMFTIHEFLNITFDGDIIKIHNRKLTEKRTKQLIGLLR